LAGVGVGDGVAPFGVVLLVGGLAGDVGDHTPIPAHLTGMLDQPGEGVEPDGDINHPTREVAVRSRILPCTRSTKTSARS